MRRCTAILTAGLGVALMAPAPKVFAGGAQEGPNLDAAALSAPVLAPRDAGARLGQARGAASACEGAALGVKAEELAKFYSGAGLEAFTAEAEKIAAAWKQVTGCIDNKDPNRCRLILVWSCRDARREIGPEGSVLPGLLVQKN